MTINQRLHHLYAIVHDMIHDSLRDTGEELQTNLSVRDVVNDVAQNTLLVGSEVWSPTVEGLAIPAAPIEARRIRQEAEDERRREVMRRRREVEEIMEAALIRAENNLPENGDALTHAFD